jgi:NTE family protein
MLTLKKTFWHIRLLEGLLSFHRHLMVMCCLIVSSVSFGQRVALVLSGGGAKGLAHLGVLKVLEEHNIPIDYVVGTSMGGIVGAFYAAGYSVEQMEKLARSPKFQNWVNGRIERKYSYEIYTPRQDAGTVQIQIDFDSLFQSSFQPRVINDAPLNMAFAELFSTADAASNLNFDSLMIPFRAVAADIFTQREVILARGRLSEAARATMSVPLFFEPIKVNGKYLYDGGIYNNFPVDVAIKEFNPDVIIGVNVSEFTFTEYPESQPKPDPSELLRFIALSKSDSTRLRPVDIYIQPDDGELTAFDFTKIDKFLYAGYSAAMEKLPEILHKIGERQYPEYLYEKRLAFQAEKPDLVVTRATFQGLKNVRNRQFISRLFKPRKGWYVELDEIRDSYFRLSQAGHLDELLPTFAYDSASREYIFNLSGIYKRKFKLGLGGVVATRNIAQAFASLEYKSFGLLPYTFYGNVYSGPFYNSVKVVNRFDLPTEHPFYLEPDFTFNRWDYLATSELLLPTPREQSYIISTDIAGSITLGTSVASRGLLKFKYKYFFQQDQYSPLSVINSLDTFNVTHFYGSQYAVEFEHNSLNYKQYANEGAALSLRMSYIAGTEDFYPGTLVGRQKEIRISNQFREWFRLNLQLEKYFKLTHWYRPGVFVQGVLSNQPVFTNYVATIIHAPAFLPLQDSRANFLRDFRSFNFIAYGLKQSFTLIRNFQFRAEAYGFTNLRPIVEVQNPIGVDNRATVSEIPLTGFIASGALVWSTSFGPVALGLNYYDNIARENRLGVIFHLGFLLYNKGALE